ncbi:MAG TPA: hypothetical protein VFD01_22120, partial [Candidatus Dormibacteraeota bacterium]|nr:hypothetical protein [Candidatus Dormibacteraeota bacterium]
MQGTRTADHGQTQTPEADPGRLIARFLAGRSPATARAYAADLEDYARCQDSPPEEAVRALLLDPGSARRR